MNPITAKTAVMYGAGNIGRGFIGERFFLSGYHTAFIDISRDILRGINKDRQYPLYVTDGADYRISIISNISAIDGNDSAAVSAAIADCAVMATAVGVNVLPYIVGNIAAGIVKRYQSGAAALNILLCENLLDCDKYLRRLIAEQLEKDGADTDILHYFTDSVGLIETSVGRMVPSTPDAIRAEHPLAVCVEPFCTLLIDADAICGTLPSLQNVEPHTNFALYIRRKLYMHNMGHAILAYLGFLKGYTYIWEAAGDTLLCNTVKGALAEAARALSLEYGADLQMFTDHANDLLARFQNKLLGDTVLRVGRDTVRKLAPNDRLTGAYLLAKKHGIDAIHIYEGIRAALRFHPPADFDPQSHEVYEYAQANGEAAALAKYCGIKTE